MLSTRLCSCSFFIGKKSERHSHEPSAKSRRDFVSGSLIPKNAKSSQKTPSPSRRQSGSWRRRSRRTRPCKHSPLVFSWWGAGTARTCICERKTQGKAGVQHPQLAYRCLLPNRHLQPRTLVNYSWGQLPWKIWPKTLIWFLLSKE